jgi:hypothetical protein
VKKKAVDLDDIPCDRHFSAQTIAAKFDIGVDLVLAEQDAGRLPYVRFGSRRVVPESAIKKYIEARAVGDHPQRPLERPAPRRKPRANGEA